MPTKIQGGLGIDKVQDGTVGMSSVDTELYGKITALTTINLGEAKTASGTFVDFDVPLGVKRVTVMFDGVSTNGTSPIQIQIGDTEGVNNTGYNSSATSFSGGTQTTSATGALVTATGVLAADTHSGVFVLTNVSSNSWVFCGTVHRTSASYGFSAAGQKSLSGPLTKLRITTVNGTDQFDLGTINISWEF